MIGSISSLLGLASGIFVAITGAYGVVSLVRKTAKIKKVKNSIKSISNELDKPVGSDSEDQLLSGMEYEKLKDLGEKAIDTLQACKDLENEDLSKEIRKIFKKVLEGQLNLVNKKQNRDPMCLYRQQDLCEFTRINSEKYGFYTLKDRAEELLMKLKSQLRQKVRLYLFIEDETKRDQWATVLLRQNQIQPLFQFEIMRSFPKKIVAVKKITETVKSYENIIETHEAENGLLTTEDVVRIIITELPLPKNYYLWGHFSGGSNSWQCPLQEDHFFVISLDSISSCLSSGGISDNQAILRIVQRAAVLSIVPKLENRETYGCLFDFAKSLKDTRYFISNAFICEYCCSKILKAKSIPEGHRSHFLEALQQWLKDTDAFSKINNQTEQEVTISKYVNK